MTTRVKYKKGEVYWQAIWPPSKSYSTAFGETKQKALYSLASSIWYEYRYSSTVPVLPPNLRRAILKVARLDIADKRAEVDRVVNLKRLFMAASDDP